MTKFDVNISYTVRSEYNGSILFSESIDCKSVPAKILVTLLTWVYKLTEAYVATQR